MAARSIRSKPQRHPDVARLKSQPRVEPLGIDAGVVREQLDQLATLGARFRDGPLHDALSDAEAAAMRGDANVLDQAARGAVVGCLQLCILPGLSSQGRIEDPLPPSYFRAFDALEHDSHIQLVVAEDG